LRKKKREEKKGVNADQNIMNSNMIDCTDKNQKLNNSAQLGKDNLEESKLNSNNPLIKSMLKKTSIDMI